MTFDLCPLKFAVYNWTAGHADRGLAGNVERQIEPQAIELLPISCKVSVVIQSFLVQHFRSLVLINRITGTFHMQLMILILLQRKYLRLAVCRKRQAKCV